MTYSPHTEAERAEMLETIGVTGIEDLLSPIPDDLRAAALQLPPPLPEAAALRHLSSMAAKNETTETMLSFLGGGAYQHHIPAAVSHLAGRGEFVTSYTPYQAELSQGTLQVMYEWQTLICELTGLDVSNAGLYDAATGCCEAAAMAINATGRGTIVVAGTLNPDYRTVLATSLATSGFQLRVVPGDAGVTGLGAVIEALDEETAALIVQSPNFLGLIEDQEPLARAAHERGALYVSVVDPLTLAVLASPGEVGADIATGDAQPFGISLQYGGPYAGFLAARESLMRRMPGRIVGASLDTQGHRAFVLTLQTREQHIKREKAILNICSNHALCATIATMYLAHQGGAGLRDTALACLQNAHYAAERIDRLHGYRLVYERPFFYEFVVECVRGASWTARALRARGILAGIPIDDLAVARPLVEEMGLQNGLLVCVTEVHSQDWIDRLVTALKEVAA